MSHRFAAILAADVAHYSTLMEGDGEGTVQALKDCRSVFQRCVSEHHGHEFGSVGDSLMAEFSSPVEALRAARCIHTELDRAVAPLADGATMQVRIGLHAGDVISDGENLFGDVVNTSARIQELAQTGSIAMSGFFHEQVKKEPGFEFRSLGSQQLKNIGEPVTVFEVVRERRRFNWRRMRLAFLPYKTAIAATAGVLIMGLLIIGPPMREETIIDVAVPGSIAVLPFTYVGEGGNKDLRTDSLQGDIITQLTQLRSPHKVPSQAEIEAVLSPGTSTESLAKALSVEHVVESDVRRAGDSLRIKIRSFNTTSGAFGWSASYDRKIGEDGLLTMQGQTAWDIAIALHLELAADQEQRVESQETANAEARNEFMLGQEEMGKMNEEGLLLAQTHFERAIELDPFYVQAHFSRADSIGLQTQFMPGISVSDRIKPWQESITAALAIAPRSGEAHVSLAYLRARQERWEDYERLLIRALELSPDYYAAHYLYALLLDGQGRKEESIIEFRKAFELNPQWPLLIRDFSRSLFELGQVEEAEVRLLNGIRQYPEFSGLYRELYMVWTSLGRSGDALRALKAWGVAKPDSTMVREWVCFALIHLGDFDEAEACTSYLEADFGDHFVVHKIMLSMVRNRPAEVLEHVDRFAKRENLVPIAQHFIGITYLYYNLPEKALPFANDFAPEMMGEQNVEVTIENLDAVLLAGAVMYRLGREERANYLFEQALHVMRLLPRTRGEGIQNRDIFIHVVRDERDLAIAALRDAIKHNWRAWDLRMPSMPMFTEMDDEPEWRRLLDQLDAEMTDEVRWYHEHKDDPLF